MNIPHPAFLKKAIALKTELQELDQQLQKLLSDDSLVENSGKTSMEVSNQTEASKETQEIVSENPPTSAPTQSCELDQHAQKNIPRFDQSQTDHASSFVPTRIAAPEKRSIPADYEMQEQFALIDDQEETMSSPLSCSLDETITHVQEWNCLSDER